MNDLDQNKHKGKQNPIFFFFIFRENKLQGEKKFRNKLSENALVIQRLGLDAFTARGPGFNPWGGTKILQDNLHDIAKKEKEISYY